MKRISIGYRHSTRVLRSKPSRFFKADVSKMFGIEIDFGHKAIQPRSRSPL
jgi:hypothetical protein